MHSLNRLCSVALGLTVWLPAAGSVQSATNSFGFAGVEILPVYPFVSHLQAADFDGTGLKDLVLVNKLRSKITLLYNQTGRTNATAAVDGVKRNINELPPDARFRLDFIPSERRINSLGSSYRQPPCRWRRMGGRELIQAKFKPWGRKG